MHTSGWIYLYDKKSNTIKDKRNFQWVITSKIGGKKNVSFIS